MDKKYPGILINDILFTFLVGLSGTLLIEFTGTIK